MIITGVIQQSKDTRELYTRLKRCCLDLLVQQIQLIFREFGWE